MIRYARSAALAASALIVTTLAGATFLRADYNTERRIDMYNIHNNETISIVYKKDGQYIPEALDKLNWFMRDWRRNEATKMDPHTIDIVWEIHEELGSKQPIHFVSGYRSPKTNEALRHAGGGQAKFSQHIQGKAMDVAFPDVPVQKLRYAGLVREQGGVGYYPTSGVPFVHIDTGSVRMWPRMPRAELALLFPKGHSRYTPQDGRPISVADVSYARSHFTQMAEAIAAFHQFRAEPKDHTMVASLEPQMVPADAAAATAADDQTDEGSADATVPAPVEQVAVKTVAVKRAVLAMADTSSNANDAPPLDGPALTAAAPKPAKAKVVVRIPKPVVASLQLASLADFSLPEPVEAVRPVTPKPARTLSIDATIAAKDATDAMETIEPPAPQVAANGAFLNQAGWASAPNYDEDHGSELSYRPFPLGGLIDATPSIDNPILSRLSRPNITAAHDSIGNDDGMGMQFRPSLQVAEMIWSDEFGGGDLGKDLFADAASGDAKSGRLVRTASSN